MTEKSDFGDRMKGYENAFRHFLPRRMPCIIRLDGCAFHTYTRGFIKPWDENLMEALALTMLHLCENIQGCKMGYLQSDEISLLLTDYDALNTCAWFDKNVQKMCSVSASIASCFFNRLMMAREYSNKFGYFDSRVFVLPEDEVCNYFLWRQRDAERNSLNGLAQQHFSHKVLQGLNKPKVHDLLMLEKGINWNDETIPHKRGLCAVKHEGEWCLDQEIPIFSQERNYINQHVYLTKEIA